MLIAPDPVARVLLGLVHMGFFFPPHTRNRFPSDSLLYSTDLNRPSMRALIEQRTQAECHNIHQQGGLFRLALPPPLMRGVCTRRIAQHSKAAHNPAHSTPLPLPLPVPFLPLASPGLCKIGSTSNLNPPEQENPALIPTCCSISLCGFVSSSKHTPSPTTPLLLTL